MYINNFKIIKYINKQKNNIKYKIKLHKKDKHKDDLHSISFAPLRLISRLQSYGGAQVPRYGISSDTIHA